MTKLVLIAQLATMSGTTPALAQTTYSCGGATVRTVEAIDETVRRETIHTRRDDDGEVRTFVTRAETQHRRLYVLTVQLGDVVYTSESAGDPYATLDPMRLAGGEAIDMCVNGAQMIVEWPDGKDYRAPVVRRAFAPVAGSGTR